MYVFDTNKIINRYTGIWYGESKSSYYDQQGAIAKS